MIKFLIFICSMLISTVSFAQETKDSWKIVPNKTVCMVTEAHFARPQIPVQVDNKTYYGCCENCKKTLTDSKKARTATDALTGKSVDKATAVIAANDSGNVLYFASQDNFKKYIEKLESAKH